MDIFHTPCSDNSEFFYLLESHFNISMGYDVSPETFWKSPFNTIHINVAFFEPPKSLDRVPRMYSAYQRHVLYCRAVTKFESTWTVWFTPYDYHCWIGLCVTVLLLPIIWTLQFNYKKWCLYYASQIYFLISVAFRQPISPYPVRYMLFVFAMLILSSGYESLITMRLILPSELFKIDNVFEFFKVRGYSQIVYDAALDTEEYDITVNDTDITVEFKKHGLINLLPKAIRTIREQLLSYEYYEMHAWKNSSVGQILNIEERLGNVELHISSCQAGILPWFQAELGEELKCRTFPIGGVFHSYAVTNVDYLWEIDRFMRHVLGDSGLRPYWAAFFLQFDQMRAMFRSESEKLKSQNLERDSSIILSSLAKFFAIWGVAIGTAGIVGSYEIFMIARDKYHFKDVVLRSRRIICGMKKPL
ncbi:hypothetical protein Fcan01_23289 [Folsomia candida]|uniref:Uncharacterized protein n=1 Tax=Folsomia candida TaxID=158441 RepID=A0A226DB52_FOLCA|nr:hypothetical protein Fcan01_23289 [Folsomia candida]